MYEPGEMVVDPAMGRVLEALDEGYSIDPDDLVEVLSHAEIGELVKRGRKWMAIALWRAEYRLRMEQQHDAGAVARAEKAEARVLELEKQLEPLRNRNRALNNALLTVRRAMETPAIEVTE